jgi:hypothetical protein
MTNIFVRLPLSSLGLHRENLSLKGLDTGFLVTAYQVNICRLKKSGITIQLADFTNLLVEGLYIRDMGLDPTFGLVGF